MASRQTAATSAAAHEKAVSDEQRQTAFLVNAPYHCGMLPRRVLVAWRSMRSQATAQRDNIVVMNYGADNGRLDDGAVFACRSCALSA